MDPPPTKSLSHVVLDGPKVLGRLATLLSAVRAWRRRQKNDHLGFTIPPTSTRAARMVCARLPRPLTAEPQDVRRTLIIEVSGGMKSPVRLPPGRHRQKPVVAPL